MRGGAAVTVIHECGVRPDGEGRLKPLLQPWEFTRDVTGVLPMATIITGNTTEGGAQRVDGRG